MDEVLKVELPQIWNPLKPVLLPEKVKKVMVLPAPKTVNDDGPVEPLKVLKLTLRIVQENQSNSSKKKRERPRRSAKDHNAGVSRVQCTVPERIARRKVKEPGRKSDIAVDTPSADHAARVAPEFGRQVSTTDVRRSNCVPPPPRSPAKG